MHQKAGWLGPRVAALLAFYLVCAVASAAEPDGRWAAQWAVLEQEGASPANQWLAFRSEKTLSAAPGRAVARIAADSKYWLWVNGRLVVREGGLKRGPTPQGSYFDEVDIGPYLKIGDNCVAALVWHFGRHGFSHVNSGRAGFLFEADLGGESWLTGADRWTVVEHPAFGATDEPHPNFRLPESNIRFDARADLVGWTEAGYDASAWREALRGGRAGEAPWGELVARPIPQWKDFGLKEFANAPALPWVSDGSALQLKLPYNAQVTPFFEIDAKAGRLVDVRTDNYRGGGAANVRAEYITSEGPQTFECFGWMNGHEVWLTFPKGVVVRDVSYRETGYDTEFAGSFRSSDPRLNRLWEKAARTLYITMRDTYMDCPDRERAQWWGDVVIELGEAFYALDRRSDLLARKGFQELFSWQRDDGSLFSPIPAGNWDKELPTQMLASVGWYGLWTYCRFSGDTDLALRSYPALRRYMELWELGEDGLVVPRQGGWLWGDWGTDKDMPLLFNGWYYLALKGQRELALLAGFAEDVPGIEQRMASVHRNFNARFWTGSAYRSDGYEGPIDDRGQGLAVVAGLAGPERYEALRRVLVERMNASPYMERYVLEALFLMGFAEDAMERMRIRYRAMLDDGLTTLYEGWGIGSEGFGGGTYNHAWSGGPLTLLSQYVAGVSPLEPAFRLFEVRPRLGQLEWAEASVPTRWGVIEVQARRMDAAFKLAVVVPPETECVLVLPRMSQVVLNGQIVWDANGKRLPIWGASALASEMGDEIRLKVGRGEWVAESL